MPRRVRGSDLVIPDLSYPYHPPEVLEAYQMLLESRADRADNRTLDFKEKNVKTAFITKGNAEEYDIEKVLRELEVSTEGKKPKRKQKKSKKKKSTAAGAEAVEVIEGIEVIEATEITEATEVSEATEIIEATEFIEATEVSTSTESNEAKITQSKPVQNPEQQIEQTEPRIPECSTCFEPRARTFLLLPCGHATFCQACAEHFCDSDDKRCPTCRTNITGKVRVFQ